MPTFAQIGASYRPLWAGMTINPAIVPQADATARRILEGKARYQALERQTTVPWFFIGLTHLREANLNWTKYLGNGQPLNRRTTIVPIGRGPFPTFEAGAIDALQKMGFTSIKDWTLERIAFCLEGFNGYGYRGKGVNSPYLWAGTNRYTKGKYVADHVFDANVVDKQLGTMAVLARLCAMDADVNARVNGAKPGAVRDPAKDTVVAGAAGSAGTVAVGVKAGWSMMDFAEMALILIACCLAIYCGLTLWRRISSHRAVTLEAGHAALMPAAAEVVAKVRKRRRS